jgi:hypothetical protein
MDKPELIARIFASNNPEEIDPNVAAAERDANRKIIKAAHVQASQLAEVLFSHYDSKVFSAFYGRSTPFIPLGLADPENRDGLTHGFAKLHAYNQEIVVMQEVRPATRFRPAVSRPVPTAGEQIASIHITVFSGYEDGTFVQSAGGHYRSSADAGAGKPDHELVAIRQEAGEAVDALLIMAQEAGLIAITH